MNVDLRSVTIFLYMQGKQPYQIHSEITGTFQNNVIGYSTITKYIRQSKSLQKVKDAENPNENFTHSIYQKQILKVLKNEPFSSIREIAELTRIPKSTVYRILKDELNYVPRHLKWVPHFLNATQKMARVELSKSLLRALEKASHQNFKFFLTGDESYFYISTDHELLWIPDGQEPPEREKKNARCQKIYVNDILESRGISFD